MKLPNETVPHGYECRDDGVYSIPDGKDPERLTQKPAWVSALSRDGNQENWGRLVHWVDHDGVQHQRALPAGLFLSGNSELSQALLEAGLPIISGKDKKLLQYLSAFTPEDRMISAALTGWHNNSFILPNETISEPDGERVVFQPLEANHVADAICSRGNLMEWRDFVAGGTPSDIVMFAIASSLSTPLRFLVHGEAGGFHFFGNTSRGKTTLLQAAASVWGNAADPARHGGGDAYIQRWNATSNALEGIAASFNDLPMIVDEIGEGDASEFGRTIYRVMSGTGRSRADRTGGLRKRRSWRSFVLSAGELPVGEYICEGGGKVRGGQLVRLVDIDPGEIFPDAESADAMKNHCANYFGTAGPTLIQSGNLLEFWDALLPECIGEAASNEAGRVRDRFRLVAYAGELAIKRRILPWDKGSVLGACQRIYQAWAATQTAISGAERGIENIRAFLMKHGGSRFERDTVEQRSPHNRAGWFQSGMYHFTHEAFKEACGGVLDVEVKRALLAAGFLHTERPGRFGNRISVAEIDKRVPVISVKSDICGEEAVGLVEEAC